MAIWNGDGEAYKQNQHGMPKTETSCSKIKIQSLGFYGPRDVARLRYEWVIIQKGATTCNGRGMVAAFWDPTIRVVYASTTPVGPRRAEMKEPSSSFGAAPAWYDQLRAIVDGKNPRFHAEDGALSNYESDRAAQAVLS